MSTRFLLLFPSILLFGCPKAPPPEPAQQGASPVIEPAADPSPTTPPTAVSPTTGAATSPIKSVIANAAHFQFSLKESADALALQTANCQKEAAGDTTKAAACLAAVEKEGAGEGIRFEQEGEKLIWVSYGLDPQGKEEIYLRGPISLLPAPDSELHFRPAGTFTGKQAAEMGLDKNPDALPPGKFMTVQAKDDKTLVMLAPPPKGALVYHRL